MRLNVSDIIICNLGAVGPVDFIIRGFYPYVSFRGLIMPQSTEFWIHRVIYTCVILMSQ